MKNKKEAYEYINKLILGVTEDCMPDYAEPHRILDLGCDVGGTLFYLAERLPIEGLGVTLSPVQVQIARDLARDLNREAECTFLEASYLELPDDLEPASFAYAVKSFIHGPNAAAFFLCAARALEPGGRLVVRDDFLTDKGARHDPADPANGNSTNRRARRNIADFRKGWRLGSLVAPNRAVALARDAGFRHMENRDLTPLLALQRPRDRVIATAVALGRWLPLRSAWWHSWLGGHTIQRCLLTGLIEFRFLVFVKEVTGGSES